MSNYPDDIHQYDNDPRSPFYDDGGYENFVEEKTNEYNDDCSGCSTIDDVVIVEIVWDEYPKFENLTKRLSEYIETKIQAQVLIDWENLENDYDPSIDDPREPEDW